MIVCLPFFFGLVVCFYLFIFELGMMTYFCWLFFACAFSFVGGLLLFIYFNLAWMVIAFFIFLVGWLFSFLYMIFFNKSIGVNLYKLLFPFSCFYPQPNKKKKKKNPSTFSFTQPNTHEGKKKFHPLTIFHPSSK